MSEGSEASYAEVVASGPSQSAEEVTGNSAANPVDEVIPTDQSIESLIDVNTGVAVVPSDFKEREVATETQAARLGAEEAAKAEAAEAEAAAARKHNQDNAAAAKKRSEKSFEETIAAANGTILAVLSVVLGVSAYRKHQVGQMSWRLAGLWGAGLAAFVGADYFVSMYVWKKCPPRN